MIRDYHPSIIFAGVLPSLEARKLLHLDVSVYGTIKENRLVTWKARTRCRIEDGEAREDEPSGTTRPTAENALKQAFPAIEDNRGGDLEATTTLRALGRRFLEDRRDLGRPEGTLARPISGSDEWNPNATRG